jgi:peroxiredoxin
MKVLKPITMMMALLASVVVMAQDGYKVGDVAADFKLKNIDGEYYSLADIDGAKGYIVIFTCNHCPYSIAYEDRIIDLHNTYAPMGYPVVAVNPNDSIVQPGDSWSKMKVRAEEKKFPFLYLLDEKQEVFPVYGATRTPHVFLLKKESDASLRVAYIGAIDDNYKDAAAVEKPYLADAIMAVDQGKAVPVDYTRAIGCTIKVQN